MAEMAEKIANQKQENVSRSQFYQYMILPFLDSPKYEKLKEVCFADKSERLEKEFCVKLQMISVEMSCFLENLKDYIFHGQQLRTLKESFESSKKKVENMKLNEKQSTLLKINEMESQISHFQEFYNFLTVLVTELILPQINQRKKERYSVITGKLARRKMERIESKLEFWQEIKGITSNKDSNKRTSNSSI